MLGLHNDAHKIKRKYREGERKNIRDTDDMMADLLNLKTKFLKVSKF